MTLRTARILVAAGAFVAGLVLCTAVVLLVMDGERRAEPAAGRGDRRTVQPDRPQRPHRHRAGPEGPAVPGVLRLHPLSRTSARPTLFEISEVLRELGPDADRARALFITVDPERDTPAALKDYRVELRSAHHRG